jgi:hypothetical protein
MNIFQSLKFALNAALSSALSVYHGTRGLSEEQLKHLSKFEFTTTVYLRPDETR